MIEKFLPKKKAKESSNFIDWGSEFASTLNNKFAKDIFTLRQRDMHEEFRQCKKAFYSNSLINAAITTMVDLIKGEGYYVESNNLKLAKYLEDYCKRTGLYEAYKTALLDYAITGNGYIEVIRNKKGEVVKYAPYSNAEDIYIDYDYQTNKIKRYIQRTLVGEHSSDKAKRLNSGGQKTTQHVILTPQGRQTITGIVVPKENLIPIKQGINIFGVYGRSEVASVLDDLRMLESIDRSVAVIARYKAIPKKILTKKLNDNIPGNRALTQQEINQLSSAMKMANDEENFILNGEWETVDLSDGGKDIRLEGYIDYLKRKITIALAPEFIIHGENTNRATSREQKQVYELRISTKRQNPEQVMTQILTPVANEIMKVDPTFAGTFMFKNGDYDILLPEEKEIITRDRWQSGIITLAEAREELNLPEVDGTDVFNWEVSQAQAAEFPALPTEKLKLTNESKKGSNKKSRN